MATFDDKILGEKLHNYCSSSEDEGGSEDEGNKSGDEGAGPVDTAAEPAPVNSWNGTATNTGPKGVIEDWRRFKQLEAENRKATEKKKITLAKKLTMAVKTDKEATAAQQKDDLEDELNELVDEEFLLKYQKQRLEELMSQLQKTPQFGKVVTLESKDDFLNAVDKENPKVTVIVHIFNAKKAACETMDGCLNILAGEYADVKFCRIHADVAGLSKSFRIEGVPALLVYKGGQIVGNFVQLAAELGNDFFANDVERFLIEYGILPENKEV